MKRLLWMAAVVSGVVLGVRCASQGYPGGGPVDDIPPFVVSTEPSADSTHVGLDADVLVHFSEPVQPNSCEPLIFITPFVARDRLKFDWKKDRHLTIRFKDPLMQNQTYVVTIGAGTRDRRSNPMRSSFTLAFSTGHTIDRGQLSGQVYSDQNVKGTKVWAYAISDSSDPNPAEQSPLYITQVSEEGEFALKYMAEGHYRLFAVLDRDLNNLYNTGFDKLGVAPYDVYTDSLHTPRVVIRTVLRDTLPPVIAAVQTLDASHVHIRFSEAMLTVPDSLNLYAPVSNGDTLQLLDFHWDPRNSAVLHLTTERQQSADYEVNISRAYDTYYNALPPDSGRFEFTGAVNPDTTSPSIFGTIPNDSMKLRAPDSQIELIFTKAMDTQSVQTAFTLADTLAGDTIGGGFEWPHLAHAVFTPDSLSPETRYRFSLQVETVTDLAGNTLSDTLVQQDFHTWNPDTLSDIAGTVIDPDTTAQGPVFLYARELNQTRRYELFLASDGPYRFRGLLPGQYLLQGFRDTDGNGRYSTGQAYPWEPAEVFFVYPDTVSIRSRWPNEGNNIVIPR